MIFPGWSMVYWLKALLPKELLQAWIQKRQRMHRVYWLLVTHLNCPKLPGYESTAADIAKRPEINRGFRVFTDNIIRFSNQPIAIVVADTYERAVYAASLIKATYKKDKHNTDLNEAIKTGKPVEGNNFKDYVRGEADAWKNAEVKIEVEYSMPLEVHNPMEIHGTHRELGRTG